MKSIHLFRFFNSGRLRAGGSYGAAALAAVLSGAVCGQAQAQSVVVTGNVSPGSPTSPVWTTGSTIYVGSTGAGSLLVEGGGTVSSSAGVLGRFGAGAGNVTVTGEGSTWTNSGNLTVGSLGDGVLLIADGGAVSNATGLIGSLFGSSGDVTVTGEGSTWTNSGALTVGATSDGVLRIEDGGAVSNTNGSVGAIWGAGGEVTVTGEGSTWTNSGTLIVGGAGEGVLRIEAGGVVSNTNGTVGAVWGADGEVTVTGAGSAWTNSGTLTVGGTGQGTLRIEDGGVVSNTDGSVGAILGATGEVTVTGTDSKWTNSGSLVVGNLATGTVAIENGGRVEVGTFVQLGGLLTGNGTLNLNEGGTLAVGGIDGLQKGTGTAAFNLAGGTLEVVGSELTASVDATLTNASTLDTNGLGATLDGVLSGTGSLVKAGEGALTLTNANTYEGGTTLGAGTLRIGNDFALGTGALTIEDGATLATDGSARSIANNLVVNGDFSVFPEGTMLNISSFALTGNVDLAGGNRTITNSSDFWNSEWGVVELGGVISNGGLILKALPGSYAFFTMTGSQSNTYTGDTVVGEGVSLQLLRNGQTAIAGDLYIENDAVVVTDWSDQIADTSNVTITGIGRLQVGVYRDVAEEIGGLFGDGEVALNDDDFGSFLVVNSGEFSGTITGGVADNLSLVKEGAGVLVLSGDNTFLGNTVVDEGTLQIGAGGTTGSVLTGIELRNGSSLVFDRSDDSTAGNLITGDGTLTKKGAGVLTLTAANTYSAGTTVSGGLIEFATDANLGTGVITLDGGGLRWATGNTLDISARLGALGAGGGVFDTHGNDVTFASVVSGDGQFTKDGAGVLTLAGANTYTGGTLVLGGELVVTSGTLPGDTEVGAGAFLTFDQADDGTYTGRISGAGGVRFNGDGTVTFTAVQSYTGETEINGGALQATTDSLAGGDISIAAGSGLIFNQAGDGTYAGVISGDGGLVKLGAGAVNLTGAHTYTGPTLINGGGLSVNGSLASTSVTVGSGAFLGGSGTITGDVVVQSGGILAPGNSPGLLTVGSLALNSGSITQMEIHGATTAGADYDQIRVTGEATLDGTLELILGGGYAFQAGDEFVLIDADTITTGSDFAVINGLGNALTFTTTITDDFTLKINVLQTDFAAFALTPNQRAVTLNLDADWANPSMETLIHALNALPGSSLPAAFDRIAPEEYAALVRVAQSNTRSMWSGLRQRLAEIRGGSTGLSLANLNFTGRNGRIDLNNSVLLAAVGDTADAIGMRALAAQSQAAEKQADERRGFFVSGTGTFGDNENDGNAAGYEFAAGGLMLGTDVRLTPDAAVGVMAGYGHTETDYQSSTSDTDTETARIGLYGTWSGIESSWLNATAGAAYHWYDSEREALGGTASGETEGAELNALIEAGRDFRFGRLTLTPSAGLDYLWLRTEGFTETGSLAPLAVNDQTGESLRSELALTASWRFEQGKTTVWSPFVRAGWQHEFLDTYGAVDARLASGAGTLFSVKGTEYDRDSAILGAGVQARLSATLDVSLSYSGELNTDYQSHSVNGQVRLKF